MTTLCRHWLAWDVPTGKFYLTKDEALADKPEGATQLLWQLRDEDGELIGRAFPATDLEVPS